MNTYDIATTTHSWRNTSPDGVQNFIRFVRETSDPVVKGLVSIMAEEIKHRRLNEREYMGGNSVDISECVADSEPLLARLLLDKSSHGNPSQIYVKAQLQNLAWDKGRHKDPVEDWVNAEREYVREGLLYIAKLQPE